VATPVTASLAFDEISYPERSEDTWLYRAEALLLLDSSPDHPRLTAESLRELASRAELGWDVALYWLDRITALTWQNEAAGRSGAGARFGGEAQLGRYLSYADGGRCG